MSSLSGLVTSSMTQCGHEATECSRSGAGDEITARNVAAMAKRITWFQAVESLALVRQVQP